MRVAPVLLVLGACGFSLRPVSDQLDDGGSDASTRDGDAPRIVPLHVPPGGQAPGSGDLVVTAAIDTGALTVDGAALPTGVTFDSWTQPGGVELAVLHVDSLTVPTGAEVRVTGSRALVVVAANDITIHGTLLGGARRDVAGPGGAAPDLGDGRGSPGAHAGTYRDSGGSGAGFAADGGIGGAGGTTCPPPATTVGTGVLYGDPQLAILHAGSGGGTAFLASCGVRPAGAGGGAIQLTSSTRVVINGGVDVGGGGGGGGRSLTSGNCNMGAGSGGGSGGSIVLQAPNVTVAGTLTANGGAGGSSAGDPNGDNQVPVEHGVDGQDGGRSDVAAMPGPDVGFWSSAGGAGGARNSPAGGGASNSDCDGNGGGGGGAVGRIVIAVAPTTGVVTMTGTDSPAHVPTTY